MTPDLDRITKGYAEILAGLGFNQLNSDLEDTPRRAAKAIVDLTEGGRTALSGLRVFDEPSANQMVVVGPIPFWSLCEHHLMPFSGEAWVGYVPQGRIIGLSKIPRLVLHYAQRLQNQERLASTIADALMNVPTLRPIGVGVHLQSQHSCMAARGVRSPGTMITSALRGSMLNDPACRQEFLSLARGASRG